MDSVEYLTLNPSEQQQKKPSFFQGKRMVNRHTRILVVDDEPDMVTTLKDLLVGEGHQVDVAYGGDEALNILQNKEYEILLTDLSMPHVNGVDLLRQGKEHYPDLEVVIITGYGTIESAIEATRLGAFNYMIKPVEPQDILSNITRIKELLSLKKCNESDDIFHGMVGQSQAMQRVFRLIPKLAQLESPILIQGETGTGKELLARALHACSRRRNEPFIPLDCGALPESLLESELFGHKQGSFTGSLSDRMGLIEAADHGCLLLDEIGNASFHLQTMLLRVIEEKRVRKVGNNAYKNVDFCVIAAANMPLLSQVEAGVFREDLYYRLCGFVVELPSLRERQEDIPLLAGYFLRQFAECADRPVAKEIAPEAMDVLTSYAWPGNVRELRLLIERAAVLAEGPVIRRRDLVFLGPKADTGQGFMLEKSRNLADLPFYTVVEDVEKRYLSDLLEKVEGNISQASRLSGASRKTIREKGKRYGLLD